MSAMEYDIRRELWDAVYNVVAFSHDDLMNRYYLGKLSGIRTILPYVHGISSKTHSELDDLIINILLK